MVESKFWKLIFRKCTRCWKFPKINLSENFPLYGISQDMYTDFFTLILANYFRLNNFLYKIPPIKATIFCFLTSLRITSIAYFAKHHLLHTT